MKLMETESVLNSEHRRRPDAWNTTTNRDGKAFLTLTELTGFGIAGGDQKFVWAKAILMETRSSFPATRFINR